MIQRSPTYIVKSPFSKTSESLAMKWLPESLGLSVNRWYVIFLGWFNFKASKRYPDYARDMLEKRAWEELKGSMSKEDFTKHFSPNYNPWDQRVCLSPNGDFFEAIREKEASVVTGHIDKFVEDGVLMKDGKQSGLCASFSSIPSNMRKFYIFSALPRHSR